MGIQFILESIFVWVAYLGYKLIITLWQERANITRAMLGSIARLYLISVLIPGLGSLFAPLLAGAYVAHGLFIFIMFNLALLAIAWLAHQMSRGIEQSRAQTAQIEKLEALGRAILKPRPTSAPCPTCWPSTLPPCSLTPASPSGSNQARFCSKNRTAGSRIPTCKPSVSGLQPIRKRLPLAKATLLLGKPRTPKRNFARPC